MAVRTKSLYLGPTPGVAVFSPVYTCPAGETTILKHIVAFCTSSPSTNGFLRLNRGGVFVNIVTVAGAFPYFLHTHVWIVLKPGDTLDVWESIASAWDWILSGTELEGVAD